MPQEFFKQPKWLLLKEHLPASAPEMAVTATAVWFCFPLTGHLASLTQCPFPCTLKPALCPPTEELKLRESSLSSLMDPGLPPLPTTLAPVHLADHTAVLLGNEEGSRAQPGVRKPPAESHLDKGCPKSPDLCLRAGLEWHGNLILSHQVMTLWADVVPLGSVSAIFVATKSTVWDPRSIHSRAQQTLA